jgi:hypothetical protein
MAGLPASLLAANIGLTAGATISSTMASRAQERFEGKVLSLNQRIVEEQASDVLRRSEFDIRQVRLRGAQIAGSQRARLAVQGIDISEGSAAEVQRQTAELTAEDVKTIRSNAYREAAGFKIQSIGIASQRRLARIAGRAQRYGTLLTGGLSIARTLSDYTSRYPSSSSPTNPVTGRETLAEAFGESDFSRRRSGELA